MQIPARVRKYNIMRFLPKLFVFFAPLALAGLAYAADSVDDLIANGDVLEAKFRSAEALKCYLPAEKMEPSNADLLVRIARQYRHLMSDAKSTEQKLKYGCIAIDYSKRAVACNPNDADAYLAL